MNTLPYRPEGVFVPSLYNQFRRQFPNWELPPVVGAKVELKNAPAYWGGVARRGRIQSCNDELFTVEFIDAEGEVLLDGDDDPITYVYRWADEGDTWEFEDQ